jgi:hypothetical protein
MGGADSHRLLAAIEVKKTGDVPLGILLSTRIFKLAAKNHLFVEL